MRCDTKIMKYCHRILLDTIKLHSIKLNLEGKRRQIKKKKIELFLAFETNQTSRNNRLKQKEKQKLDKIFLIKHAREGAQISSISEEN